MTIRDVLTAAVILGAAMYLSFVAGELHGVADGRREGYRICVAEEDDDRPRAYR